MKKIVCIIPSTGTDKTLMNLIKCIRSLRQSAFKSVFITIMVVSENKHLKRQKKSIGMDTVLTVSPSLGFGQMNNMAIDESISRADADYFFFINDDAWVQNDFFKNIIHILQHSHPDLINPIIYQPNAKMIDSFGVEYFQSGYAKNAMHRDTPTTLATAACLLVKTAFLKKMKKYYGFYFNPILHYYLEDVEFSIRSLGINGSIEKSDTSVAYHRGSQTAIKKSYFTIYHTYRNLLWVILMTWPVRTIVSKIFPIIMVQSWLMLYATWKFGLSFYAKILMDTMHNFQKIRTMRKQIISQYTETSFFSRIFSLYVFRTGKGKAL